MSNFNRRGFLKASGLTVIPALLPLAPTIASNSIRNHSPAADPIVYFFFDGEFLEPTAYLAQLQKINETMAIGSDSYGSGGAVEALEKKFAAITGKEQAVFLPTGTMANQFAIKLLSGDNAKVFVQETSHVFRDEADAAQTVHNKRLIPLAKGEAYFTEEELDQTVNYHNEGEVFKSGMGAVSIENPVRRAEGRMIPFDEIKKISAYCKKNNLGLHLDGARLYMASAWSGTSIAEYSSYFDTVYISLYKYLGASAGAVLCGSKALIGKIPHLMKIHGGAMYSNWTNVAMALHKLETYETTIKEAREKAENLFRQLNQLPEIKINPLKNGTNIYSFEPASSIDITKLATHLSKNYRIMIGRRGRLTVNETILYRTNSYLVNAFKDAVKEARS